MVILLVLALAASIGFLVAVALGASGPSGQTAALRAALADRDYYGPDPSSAGTPMLQRAVALTERVARRHTLFANLERSLRAADVPLRPAELLLAHTIAGSALVGMAWALTKSSLLTAGTALVAAALPYLVLRVAVARRRHRFLAQLPDTLLGLAGSLRAGRSVPQALETIAVEASEPMGRELRKVVAEIRLGQPFADAMAAVAERVNSEDFDWVVLAMRIQTEVGGNLAELLDRVAQTVRSRANLRGEVKALTAEGRASAGMLVIMPPALGAVMYVVNREYMGQMFRYTAGHVMLGLSALMIVGGWLWMRKVVSVDV